MTTRFSVLANVHRIPKSDEVDEAPILKRSHYILARLGFQAFHRMTRSQRGSRTDSQQHAGLTRWDAASSFGAAMLPAHEAANRNAERSCQRRQDPLVGGFAGFEALDRAR